MKEFYLNHRLLRELDNEDLARYLRSVQVKHSEDQITAEISAAVQHESVPGDAYCLWLSISKTTGPIAAALQQTYSTSVRSQGIKSFGKWLRSPNWESVWDEVGKAKGLISLFSRLSVLDVKSFCKILGRCGNGEKSSKREESIEQLLRGLLRSIFPNSDPQSNDERPVDHFYIQISPACSAEFVRELLDKATYVKNSELPISRFTSTVAPLFREYAIQAIFKHQDSRFDLWDYLPALLERHPPLKGELGFSASMTFSANILRRIVAQERSLFPARAFLPTLVEPLLKRAVKRKRDYSRLEEIVRSAVSYVEAHSECHDTLANGDSPFQTLVVRLWSRRSDLFEKHLVSVLKLSRSASGLRMFEVTARKVPQDKRFDLLRLYCLHAPRLQVDIENDTQLLALRGMWNISHFTVLPRERSLLLLKRFMKVSPEGDFFTQSSGRTLLSYPVQPQAASPDPKLLFGHLRHLSRDPAPSEAVRESVNEHKALSLRSRDQDDRAFHAKAALFHAIANGSVEIYHETLTWAQRFVRDPLTLKSLFSEGTVTHSVRLLAFPSPTTHQLTAASIRDHVSEANKVLLTFLETACLAMREPSFKSHDWRGPLGLFRSVVDARLSCLEDLSESTMLSDSDIYDALWLDTTQTLLQAEKIGHRPGYEGLQFNKRHGPLGYSRGSRQADKVHHLSFYRFLDTMAQERDLLWKELRPITDPEVTLLHPPWPRGLPVQDLVLDYNVTHMAVHGLMPYIFSRSAAVVSIDENVAGNPAPQKSATQDAIGPFVDSFKLALKIQIMQQPSEAARSSCLARLWSHAFNNLAFTRMNSRENLRFWRSIFKLAIPALVHELPEQQDPEYPLLPEDADPQGITEWNPAFGELGKEESRALQPTVLDCLLNAGVHVPRCSTISYHPPAIWSFRRSRRIREGTIASTTLFLDSRRSVRSGARLFSSPFPSPEDVRYPPLILDSEFLLRRDLNETYALSNLSSVLKGCPPHILLDLALSLVNELSQIQPDNPRISSLERIAYGALRLLCTSDRPMLASNPITKTILDRPGASSWHRQLLTKSFLRSLEPSAAKSTFMEFAKGIQEKLEMSKRQDQEGPQDPKVAKPFVKITTVKFLAQLLDDADFISVKDVIEVLTNVLRNASHIDIRVAVIETMLAMIARNEKDSSELVDHVFQAFEALVPTLGGFDERHQMDEDDWVKAESSAQMPYVEIASLPPLLEAFIRVATGDYTLPDALRRDLTIRILLPSLEISLNNNKRWLRNFLSVHGYLPERLCLPAVPVKSLLLPRLISRATFRYLPSSVLAVYANYVQYLIQPSPELSSLLEHIKSDAALRMSNSGKHFLSLFDQQLQNVYNIASILTKPFPEVEVRDGITVRQVQACVISQCWSLLHVSGPSFKTWHHFVGQLQPPFPLNQSTTEEKRALWQQNVRLVLERVTADVESFRSSSKWQNNPKRPPTVLPRIFYLRTWLLPYTVLENGRSNETLYEGFTSAITSQLAEIVRKGLAAHLDDLEDITAMVMRLQDWNWKVNVACLLGDLSAQMVSPIEHLKIRIAAKLLQNTTEKRVARGEWIQMTALFEKWKKCGDEEIRLRGLTMEEKARKG